MSKWLSGLCFGLATHNVQPLFMGHCYERVWPWGRIFPGRPEDFDSGFKIEIIRYLNLPGIRNKVLEILYLYQIKRFLKEGTIKHVITYNPLPWHIPAAKACKEMGGSWTNVVLDYSEKDLGAGWSRFNSLCGIADRHVFLSWWAFENAEVARKLHLDSGYNELHQEPKKESHKRIVLYAGKVNFRGGSKLMAEAFLNTPGEDVEFWVCGKGNCGHLSKAAKTDQRIKLVGFVTDEELHRMCLEADVFINPRDPSHVENRMIFPSKILHYLSYGKPVVSTVTPGLPPEYFDFLFFPEHQTPQGLSEQLTSALGLGGVARAAYQRSLFSFLRADKSWSVQAGRLLHFMELDRTSTASQKLCTDVS